MSSLQRIENNDGIELIINNETKEIFYPGYRALARVCSIGLDKLIDPKTISRTVESVLEGVANLEILEAEIDTPGGLQGVALIPMKVGTRVIKKHNFSLYETMADAGHALYLLDLVGYKIKVKEPEVSKSKPIDPIFAPELQQAKAEIDYATEQYKFWKSENNIRMMQMWETRVFQLSESYLSLKGQTQPIINGQPTQITGNIKYEGIIDVAIRLGYSIPSNYESSLGRYAGKHVEHLRIPATEITEDAMIKDYRTSAASGKVIPAFMYPAYHPDVEECVHSYWAENSHKFR